MRQLADAAADYLEQKQWGAHETIQNEVRTKPQNRQNAVFNCEPFMLSELEDIVKRLKKNKASGPDEVPMEFFKWLDESNLGRVLELLNFWWENNIFPEDKLKAYVASIYKKGDPKQQGNYRPISLLSSIYKIYAAMLQSRISQRL